MTPLSDISDLYLAECKKVAALSLDHNHLFKVMLELMIWSEHELSLAGVEPRTKHFRDAIAEAKAIVERLTTEPTSPTILD